MGRDRDVTLKCAVFGDTVRGCVYSQNRDSIVELLIAYREGKSPTTQHHMASKFDGFKGEANTGVKGHVMSVEIYSYDPDFVLTGKIDELISDPERHYRDATVLILCFSIGHPPSFQNIKTWYSNNPLKTWN